MISLRPDFVRVRHVWTALATAAVLLPAVAGAQPQTPPVPQPQATGAQTTPPSAITPCAANEVDQNKQPLTNLPPADSAPVFRCLQLLFHPVNQPSVDLETYLYYIQNKVPSARSTGNWVPYREEAFLDDFDRLWRTPFLENLWIEVIDEPYSNGVVGKHVIFHMEERSRIKQVDYLSTEEGEKLKVEVSKIEETLRERNVAVRLDSFVDDATIRRVTNVIRELHAEKGYHDVTIEPATRALPGGPKIVHLTFNIDSGPRYKIREVVFEGNEVLSDRSLRGQLKDNRSRGLLSFITGGGTYQSAKWPDDAVLVETHYKNKGYARARVGDANVEVIEDSEDGDTRWIRLRVPVDEGPKYTVGEFQVSGSGPVNVDYLRSLFKLSKGDTYSLKKIDKGIEKAGEAFGAAGFVQAQPDPTLDFLDFDEETGKPIEGPAVVNIDMKYEPGEQYFVNRITFTGNTTTHDSVIRREMRIAEGGVFSSVGLRESIRRLNQLGYFQPMESSDDIKVDPVPGATNRMNVSLNFTEQNRNQISFGAGVSQFDGFFGQLGYQTSNFLGRGETLSVNLQRGSQAENYQVAFTEPYLFERPITVGFDVYKREYDFPLQYTQDSLGSNFLFGFPVSNWTRSFIGYSFERVEVRDINPAYLLPEVLESSPYLRDSLLLDTDGRRTVSKISPSIVYNTVDHPIFPTSGKRFTGAFDFAGLGGNTTFVQTRLESILYFPLSTRFSLGLRGEAQYIRPFGQTTTLPIFERVFLGGEYSVRGFDIRTIGPRDETGRVVVGGNKSLTLNAEFYINVAGPVRLLAFYDAGQVRDIGDKFGWWENVTQRIDPPGPTLFNPLDPGIITDPSVPAPQPEIRVIGRRNAFRTSTGLELRFFMPVLNVPFRLIAAYNPQRGGILNNSFLPQQKFTFRFAVGTTF